MKQELAERQEQPQQVATVTDTASIMAVISRAASDPNTDVEKLERMMAMYERMESRQSEVAFNAALTQLQADLPEITERGQIKHGEKIISTYAKWEDVNRVIKPILKDHGFGLSFRVDTADKVHVEAVLSHDSGHSERTSITLPSDSSGSKNPVQAVASSVSYGKRYTAGALLNLTSGGEDDDGSTAVQVATIDDKQKSILADLIAATETNEALFLKWVFPNGGQHTLDEIPASMFKKCETQLKRKLGK